MAEPLGDLTPFSPRSFARATTPDGSVVVGEGTGGRGTEAFRWEAGEMTGLGFLPSSYELSEAWDVSDDGRVIVGSSYYQGAEGTGMQAARWVDGAVSRLPELAGGGFHSAALVVSGDGSLVAGQSSSELGIEGVLWASGGAPIPFGDLPGGTVATLPRDMTPDGSVVVGRASSALGDEAFRWEGGVTIGLGDLPGGPFASAALAVSGDGTLVVGESTVGPALDCHPSYRCADIEDGFIWTAERGMRPLKEFLQYGCGYDLAGWVLSAAAISRDGAAVVAHALAPDGEQGPLVAEIGAFCDFGYEVPEDPIAPGDFFAVDSEASALFRIHRQTGEQTLVTSFGEIYAPVDLAIGPDGNAFLVNPIWDRVVRVDPRTGGQTLIASGELLDNASSIAFASDGGLFVTCPASSTLPGRVVAVEPETGQQTLVYEAAPGHSPTAIAPDRDGGLVVGISGATPAVIHLDPATGTETPITSGGLLERIGGVVVEASGELVVSRATGFQLVLIRVDRATGEQREFTEAGSFLRLHHLGITRDGTLLVPTGDQKRIHGVDPDTGERSLVSGFGRFQWVSSVQELRPVCSDGFDNDGDGLTDFPWDPDCREPGDPTEDAAPIEIDIKPRRAVNTIRCRALAPGARARIPVAILTTDSFDAMLVDHTTVRFEGAAEVHVDPDGEARRHEEDVDGDGDLDLLFHFVASETALTCESTEGVLRGETFADQGIEGRDAIRVLPPAWCCGMGLELTFLLPLLLWLRRRRG